MIIIVTRDDIDDKKRNKEISKLSESDFVHRPHNMPKESLWETLNMAKSCYYVERKGVNILSHRHRVHDLAEIQGHDLIGLIVRELNHYEGCEIDFAELVKVLSLNLLPEEMVELAKFFEKKAMEKS